MRVIQSKTSFPPLDYDVFPTLDIMTRHNRFMRQYLKSREKSF